jgi:hypothetical protein
VAAAILSLSAVGNSAMAGFATFVPNSELTSNPSLFDSNVISYAYAGNKFVGGLYSGDPRLYQTDLNGMNIKAFGNLPYAGGETVLNVSVGTGGFPTGDIYAGSGADANVWHFANAGGSPTLFATGMVGGLRQVIFDNFGLFGGNMIVTTTSGNIYKVNSAGTPTLIASVGEDTEGVDVATSAWGPFAGDLVVDSEGSGTIRLVTPGGGIFPIASLGNAETVSFVPLNLGMSGNPLEGLYVANYPVDIQKAPASVFSGLQGDAVISQEGSGPFYDLRWNGGLTPTPGSFTLTQFGTGGLPTLSLPNQSEDANFVTAQKISIFTGAPEPASLSLLAISGAVFGLAAWRRRKGATV